MSGVSSSQPCPICKKEMDIYSDWKPIDSVSGECMFCGFCYWTKVEQMDLERVNELREEWNQNKEEDEERLKPMTKKEYKSFSKAIKTFW